MNKLKKSENDSFSPPNNNDHWRFLFKAVNLEPSSGNHSHQATNESRLISHLFVYKMYTSNRRL